MHFTKMQGIGNDYVYLNCMDGEPREPGKLAVAVSDRHFGIGSDGLICVCPSKRADFRMRMFNADGSEGEMCGNGIRCLGKFVYDQGLTRATTLKVETLAGIKTLELHPEDGYITSVTVDMGAPEVELPRELFVKGKTYTAYPVSMGNPHAVIFEQDIEKLDLTTLGPDFEHHPGFPNRTNTEFVEVLGRDRLKMRVWERGSGETLACGTGACAALVAAVAAGKADRSATVQLLGGELSITWDGKTGHIFMTGPAVTVYEGEWQSHS
ncbi:MAG: diaminopimelate epimerase [Oscillospiraceae bacterium]|nr:diaminopimelate epimerase [Oscillospiraceae bacterium]